MSEPDDAQRAALRSLPRVDQVASWPELEAIPRVLRLSAIREVLDALRLELRSGALDAVPPRAHLVDCVSARAGRAVEPSLRRVVNATGVLLHTNLGRAPLAEQVVSAVAEALGACDLEYDLDSGRRGQRGDGVLARLRALSGAQAALVVNNCAAAVLLAVSALCAGREVVVSRGELVEIGGSFRVPEVIVQGGARLREVGTTNRTRLADFAAACTPLTAAFLKTHASNFAQLGFTAQVEVAQLAALAREKSPPDAPEARIRVIEDLGSASFLPLVDPVRAAALGFAPQGGTPSPRAALEAGADVVLFSGDKLLGGPQAGIALGRADAIALMRRHPLYRALRPGKLTLAALDATLALHLSGDREALPLHAQASIPLDVLHCRAQALAGALGEVAALAVRVVESEATVGGGSLPGETLRSVALAVRLTASADGQPLAERLRRSPTPVIGRLHAGELLLDLRTVPASDDRLLLEALLAAAHDT